MTATKNNLPEFEDQSVHNATIRITRAGDGLSEALKIEPKALHLDDEIYFVLRGTCVQINHVVKDDVITRVHTIAADAITEVDGELAGKILTEAAEELQRKKDAISGQLAFAEEQAAEDREAADATDTPNEIAEAAARRAKQAE